MRQKPVPNPRCCPLNVTKSSLSLSLSLSVSVLNGLLAVEHIRATRTVWPDRTGPDRAGTDPSLVALLVSPAVRFMATLTSSVVTDMQRELWVCKAKLELRRLKEAGTQLQFLSLRYASPDATLGAAIDLFVR